MRFLLFPCSTTSACDMSSSGTYVAGTVTKGRFDVFPPIMTPVLRDPEPCPVELERPVALRSRALDRAIGLDEEGAFEALAVPAPPVVALQVRLNLIKCSMKYLNIFTYHFASVFVKSSFSVLIEKDTRKAFPSSNKTPMCDGPMTTSRTGIFSCSNMRWVP